MGLDNYWKVGDKEVGEDDVTFEPPLHLCGGMCSGNGQSSFRGKVYAELIEGVTGYSLYEEKLMNGEVCRIASQLENTPWSEAKEHDTWDITEEEYEDLKRMFRAYADAGAILLSWW